MSSKELVNQAMARKSPERVPVMCQMANGHTVINTGVDPIDYFLDGALWADCLIRMRALYDFDGILCHKPGRVHGLGDQVERMDRDAESPTLYMEDGARIECTRDDDAYYKATDEFAWPDIEELDLDNLLSWAPASYQAFQASKATLPISDPRDYEDHVFDTLDLELAQQLRRAGELPEFRCLLGGRAGGEDLGDADVLHERDRLALRLEADEELLGGQSAAYELQGDLALDRFGLRRQVDNTHASLAKRTHETIGANLEGLLGGVRRSSSIAFFP